MAMVISVVASKGGVGKTTLSAVLGDELKKNSSVVVLDCDCDQYSIQTIGEANIVKFDFVALKDSVEFANAIGQLKHEYDYIICDTAPHSHTEQLFLDILEVSDTVIGVTQPAPNDIIAFHKIMLHLLNTAKEYKSDQKQFALINKVENIASDIQNQSFTLINDLIAKDIEVLDTRFHNRAAFKAHGYFAEDPAKDKKKINEVERLVKELTEKGGV